MHENLHIRPLSILAAGNEWLRRREVRQFFFVTGGLGACRCLCWTGEGGQASLLLIHTQHHHSSTEVAYQWLVDVFRSFLKLALSLLHFHTQTWNLHSCCLHLHWRLLQQNEKYKATKNSLKCRCAFSRRQYWDISSDSKYWAEMRCCLTGFYILRPFNCNYRA